MWHAPVSLQSTDFIFWVVQDFTSTILQEQKKALYALCFISLGMMASGFLSGLFTLLSLKGFYQEMLFSQFGNWGLSAALCMSSTYNSYLWKHGKLLYIYLEYTAQQCWTYPACFAFLKNERFLLTIALLNLLYNTGKQCTVGYNELSAEITGKVVMQGQDSCIWKRDKEKTVALLRMHYRYIMRCRSEQVQQPRK